MTILVGLAIAAVALLVGALAGLVVGFPLGGTEAKQAISTSLRHKHEDQKLFLKVLRRELANLLLQRDPDRFERFYQETLYQLIDMGTKPQSLINAQEKLLIEKYPKIADWDHLGTRDYVLYDDASFDSDNNLYTLYRDIIFYQTIQSHEPATSSSPIKWTPEFSERELDHLRTYVKELKGTRLQYRLIEATRQVKAHENEISRLCTLSDAFSAAYYASADEDKPAVMSTRQFTARRIAVTAAENGYHIQFSDGDEGIVSFFFDDRAYVSVYGVEPGTLETTILHTLSVDRLSVPYEYRSDVALGYNRS